MKQMKDAAVMHAEEVVRSAKVRAKEEFRAAMRQVRHDVRDLESALEEERSRRLAAERVAEAAQEKTRQLQQRFADLDHAKRSLEARAVGAELRSRTVEGSVLDKDAVGRAL